MFVIIIYSPYKRFILLKTAGISIIVLDIQKFVYIFVLLALFPPIIPNDPLSAMY